MNLDDILKGLRARGNVSIRDVMRMLPNKGHIMLVGFQDSFFAGLLPVNFSEMDYKDRFEKGFRREVQAGNYRVVLTREEENSGEYRLDVYHDEFQSQDVHIPKNLRARKTMDKYDYAIGMYLAVLQKLAA